MSQATDVLTSGFTALLESNGEAVTFRSASVTVIVNRNVNEPQRPQQPNFSARLATEVELLKSAVESIPLAGEAFLDSDGYSHRIQMVASRGICWICQCSVYKPS